MISSVIYDTLHCYGACLLLILAIAATKQNIPVDIYVYNLQTLCTHWEIVRYIRK